MKPAPFEYFAPETTADAIALLLQFGDEAKVLAGGQSLVPILNLRLGRFEALIDLGKISALQTISIEGNSIRLGAMVRQCDAEESSIVASAAPLLASALPLVGHFQIRSRGTVGGSIAHADPAAECPAVALALEAELVVAAEGGERTVSASEFFTGVCTTVLSPTEILTSIRFPMWGPGSGFAVEEVARRHGDFALAGACAGVQVSEGVVVKAAISLFGLAPTPVRAYAAEEMLVGSAAPNLDYEEIAHLAVLDVDPPEDLHASRALRRRIGSTVVSSALRRALGEARVG